VLVLVPVVVLVDVAVAVVEVLVAVVVVVVVDVAVEVELVELLAAPLELEVPVLPAVELLPPVEPPPLLLLAPPVELAVEPLVPVLAAVELPELLLAPVVLLVEVAVAVVVDEVLMVVEVVVSVPPEELELPRVPASASGPRTGTKIPSARVHQLSRPPVALGEVTSGTYAAPVGSAVYTATWAIDCEPSLLESTGTATVMGLRKVVPAGPMSHASPTGVTPPGAGAVLASMVNVTWSPGAMAPAGTKMITPWSLVAVPPF